MLEGGHGGLSFLIIDRGPGVKASAIEKLGWHASDTALISLFGSMPTNMLGLRVSFTLVYRVSCPFG